MCVCACFLQIDFRRELRAAHSAHMYGVSWVFAADARARSEAWANWLEEHPRGAGNKGGSQL